MPDLNTNDAPRTQCLDSLFAQLSAEPLSGARAPSRGLNGPRFTEPFRSSDRPGSAASLAEPPKPPPALKDPADLNTACEWLHAERKRLEEYTRQQMTTIQQQHQALLAKKYATEEALVVQSQELNREIRFLASQAQLLQARARQLTERETALAEQMGKLSKAQEEFLTIQQTSKNLQKDTQTQRAYLERLLAETAQLQKQEANAHGKFETCETELKERQQAWEKKEAELAERQTQMEQRHLALERAEQAIQRRVAELDEMEERLRKDLETQERQLANERYLALERAEQAVQRRVAELDETEERLRKDLETQERQLANERRDLQGVWTTLTLQKLDRNHCKNEVE
jgi:chromosome segregation ATPase